MAISQSLGSGGFLISKHGHLTQESLNSLRKIDFSDAAAAAWFLVNDLPLFCGHIEHFSTRISDVVEMDGELKILVEAYHRGFSGGERIFAFIREQAGLREMIMPADLRLPTITFAVPAWLIREQMKKWKTFPSVDAEGHS